MRILTVQRTEHILMTNQENFGGQKIAKRKGNTKVIAMAVR
jgi:hypothetical protein